MPWQPLPRIAFAVATYPFSASDPADLPLELGDELYVIEQGGKDLQWFRGYLVAPPSLLAGLTSIKGQTLEARVFSGIFPRSCVEVREVLGEEGPAIANRGGGSANGNITPPLTPLEGDPKSIQLKLQRSVLQAANGIPATDSQRLLLADGGADSSVVTIFRDPHAPKPAAPVPMLKIGDETPTCAEEPLVDEISSCLREWHSTKLHECLLARQYPLLDKMSTLVQTLDLARRQFLHNVLTVYEVQQLREKTVWDLVRGNKIFNGEIIVRDPAARGRVLTGEDSAVEITTLQSVMSVLDGPPQPPVNEALTLHHLLIDCKAFVGSATESTTLVFFLALKAPGQQATELSENYIVEVPPAASLTDVSQSAEMRTLFTDLASVDIGDANADNELFLVVKVRSTETILTGKPSSRNGVGPRTNAVSRAATADSKPPLVSNTAKAGRRSLMWGQKAFSRNSPNASRLNSVTESDDGRESKMEDRPSTAGSYSQHTGRDRSIVMVSRMVTKTVGIGAMKLNALMKQDQQTEHVITIWAPTPSSGNEKLDKLDHQCMKNFGDAWEDVVRDLVTCKSGRWEKSRRAERVHVHLTPFNNPDADALIKATPTLLSEVPKTSKMGFSGAPTKNRSDIYVTLNNAFLPKHALLSKSTGGVIPIQSGFTGSNLLVSLEVRTATGERLEKAIYPSSNSEGQDSWASTAAERGECWNQTFKLSIPPNEVPGCHIAMTVADVFQHPFAICYIPLWEEQAFIKDGHHCLLLYKYDESTATAREVTPGKGGYLNLPWNARGKDDVSKDASVTGPIAMLRMQTYLCSTRFSQDKTLLNLLRWKEKPPADVQNLLKNMQFVPEIEIVKLLNDVFDAIFGILVDNTNNDDFEDHIFSALCRVLDIVHDRRFNLAPLVDYYVEHRFNYPFASSCLVRALTRLLANPSDPSMARQLRATFKIVQYILKFITRSRDQQKGKEADIGITSTSTSPQFTRSLKQIFKALDGLMRNTAPILVGSQTLVVQHFHAWLPELTGLLTTEEILHIAIDFLDSCALVKGKLVLYKLVLIINYSKLDLFSQPDQKAALCANTVRWLAPHWGKTSTVDEQYREQVRLCCTILATQMNELGTQVPDHLPKVVESYLALQRAEKKTKNRLSLLFPSTYPFPSRPVATPFSFEESQVELSAVLSDLCDLPAGPQLEMVEDDMATLLEDTLRVHLSVLSGEAHPVDWLSVHIKSHKSTMKALKYLSGFFFENFLPDPDDAETYNTELWKGFFVVLLKLVGSDALALETFPEQKRRAVWKIAGDVREYGADLLRKTWEAIGWPASEEEGSRYGLSKMGGYQVQYVPSLVGPIVELCLSVHEGLRRVAVEVLESMIVSEWILSEDLSTIQTEMIECLDRLFKTKPLTESILQKLFISELFALFEPLAHIPDEPLFAALKELVSTIDEFLDLLVAVHSSDASGGEASHMIHRLQLMEFLRDIQKEEIFIRYVHQLAALQANARNHTEAGLALRLHADMYEWDPTKLVPPLSDPDFPAQTQFDRKEKIYFEMIEHFENGEAWSSALAAYKELHYQYEENIYDFSKLARTEHAMATIYETIATSDRLIPKYFKVSYKGLGFPTSLRDKEFVFEGSPTERTSAFTDRMQEQHPSATITSTGEIEELEGQYLHITLLSAHRDLSHYVFQRAKVPQVVRDYLLVAHPQQFAVTTHRNITGPVQEHVAEKIVYTTADIFPTILRRSEIVETRVGPLTATQTALERIIRKTSEMAAVEKRVLSGDSGMIALLVEAIGISCNSNSESSVAKYRELIPTSTHLTGEDEEPVEAELSPIENAIRIALIDHAGLIKRCLVAFNKKDDAVVTKVRQDELLQIPEGKISELLQSFEETFAPELASFSFPARSRTSTLPEAVSWVATSKPASLSRQIENSVVQADLDDTVNTSVLASPPHRDSNGQSKRLSFLKRGTAEYAAKLYPPHSPLRPTPEGAETDVTGSASNFGSPVGGKGSGKDGSRRSFFSQAAVGMGLVVGDGEWVTQSDMSEGSAKRGTSMERSGGARDSSRPSTAGSGGGGRMGGGLKKRFSMLGLGRKRNGVGGEGGIMEEEAE